MPRLNGAEWLGSAGLTVLVRCVCGIRLFLSRRQWRRRGFTVCDDCRAVILYASLEIVDPRDVEEFIEMVIRREEEREGLRQDVERELRRFVRVYDQQPRWLWSPATNKLVQAIRPKLELLGGAIEPLRGGEEYGAAQEAAYQGDEEDEYLLDEELHDDALDDDTHDEDVLDDEQDDDAA